MRKTFTSLRPPTVTYANVPLTLCTMLTWLVSGPGLDRLEGREWRPSVEDLGIGPCP